MNRIILQILPYILIVIISFLFFNYYQNHKNDLLIFKQNEKAKQDSLVQIIDGLYKRTLSIENINDSLNNVVSKYGEKIISYQTTIFKLNDIIQKGKAIIDSNEASKDERISFPIGTKLTFSGNNYLRNYTVDVYLNKDSYHIMNESFNPFEIFNFISRDKQGLFFGYSKLPDSLSKYLIILDSKYKLEKDEFNYGKTFSNVNNNTKSFFSFTFLTQYYFYNEKIYLGGLFNYKNYNIGYLGNFKKDHSIIIGFSF